MNSGTVFYVYLLANKPYGTLYTGMTSEIARRVWEHKVKAVPGFTTRYGVDQIVWFEPHDSAEAAMRREKQIKEWRRDWKNNLIERDNPHWIDLYPSKSVGLTEKPGNGHRPSPVKRERRANRVVPELVVRIKEVRASLGWRSRLAFACFPAKAGTHGSHKHRDLPGVTGDGGMRDENDPDR